MPVRAYEIVVIFDATLEEEAIRPVLDRATAPITRDGGSVNTDRWGKRRFAYELKHRWEGNYVLLAFNAEPIVRGRELPILGRGGGRFRPSPSQDEACELRRKHRIHRHEYPHGERRRVQVEGMQRDHHLAALQRRLGADGEGDEGVDVHAGIAGRGTPGAASASR